MPPIKSRRQTSTRKRKVESEQDDGSGYKKWFLAVLLIICNYYFHIYVNRLILLVSIFVVYVINASFVAKHIDQWHVFGIYMLSFLCFAVYVL